jgi:MinD superfamily P-loop ATPase
MYLPSAAFMVLPTISAAKCQACQVCQARQACRLRAILIEPGEQPFIDAARCYGCRACLPACPFGAVVIESRKEV